MLMEATQAVWRRLRYRLTLWALAEVVMIA